MPTAYTEVIKDGITFEQFALRFARQYPALESISGLPLDTPIPPQVGIDPCFAESVREEKENLDFLEKMSPQKLREFVKIKRGANLAELRQQVAETKANKKKAAALLKKIKAWRPPSPNHESMKLKMISSVESYMDVDWSLSRYNELINFWTKGFNIDSYCERLLQSAREDYRLACLRQKYEIERVAGHNKWIKQLRDSLKATKK